MFVLQLLPLNLCMFAPWMDKRQKAWHDTIKNHVFDL